MKRLRWLAGLVAALGLLLAALVGGPAEVTPMTTGASCRTLDEATGLRAYEPRCLGERDGGAGPVAFKINGRGFRGDAPRPGARRVLLLGGTVAWGPGLSDTEEPAAVAEAYLAEAGRTGVDVLNLSVEGFSTTDHAVRLPALLEELQPEMVVLATFTHRGMYKDHLGQVERGDKGYPLRKLEVDVPWRHFHTSWRLRFKDPVAFAGPALDSIKRMGRLCRNHGVKFRVAWDGQPAANSRHVAKHEGRSPLGLVTPRVELSAEELEWMLSRKEAPLHYAADWHPSPEHEPELFIGGGPFYSAEGMDRFGFGLARLVDLHLFRSR